MIDGLDFLIFIFILFISISPIFCQSLGHPHKSLRELVGLYDFSHKKIIRPKANTSAPHRGDKFEI